MKNPLTLLRELRHEIGTAGNVLYFKDPDAAFDLVTEVDRSLAFVLSYPWEGVDDGIYLCYIEGRDPRPVEIFEDEDAMSDQKMFRWVQGAIPGRLLHEMPQVAELIPAPQMGLPHRREGQD